MKKYKTIVIDPPWPIKFGRDDNWMNRPSMSDPKSGPSCKNWKRGFNYPTMSLDEIKSLPVLELSDTDCHLYVWVVNKFIPQSYEIVKSWKFKPVTLLTWAKTPRGLGLGGAFVQSTEHILFCRRGKDNRKKRINTTWWNWKRPEKRTGPKHSRKPEEFQDLVEDISCSPYLELFARRKRDGWDVWGNEVESDIKVDVVKEPNKDV